ncbi:hypothetical protein L1987_32382 [Smallanthus sonchifolius]|uniref:Uncharacterized protein n=1 Tax=Smallanthus sonchifolius TaxID=185202 RepID=A0ACB9HMV3_9ASTR|nr:hypothetical protein L1987_32382 [Smallanthus sonchifolius]
MPERSPERSSRGIWSLRNRRCSGGWFKERLLVDDLFLTKVGNECGVGIFTKSVAELEKKRENFTKDLDFVFADVVCYLIYK